MNKDFTVCFYNTENFFDVYDDPDKHDDEYTPSGSRSWDDVRYYQKIERLAEVIKGMGLNHTLPAFIGLAEIENRKVIEDLLAHRDLDHENFGIVHEESRDVRGIDVGFVYSKNVFEYEGHDQINFEKLTGEEFNGRDILHVWGRLINGDRIHFFVNHWSSRRKGVKETEYKRVAAANALREKVDFLLHEDPNAKLIILGDFNDEPQNKSLRSVLHAQETSTGPQSLVNLGWPIAKRQWGTVHHEDMWYLFDSIIVTGNLLDSETLHVDKKKLRVFEEEDTLYHSPRSNKVRPNRTFVGMSYKGGYSDHLAVFMRMNMKVD